MKKTTLFLLLGAVSLFGVSCNSTKTAQSDPYSGATYGSPAGADPYASSEYDNVYESGAGQTYDNASTYSGGSSYGSDGYYQDSGPAYTPPPTTPSYTPPAPTYSPPATTSSSRSHTVVKGDTLYNISKRYGTTVSAIQRANGINGDLIRLGERLVIP